MWTCASCGMPVADDAGRACPACGTPRSGGAPSSRVYTPPQPSAGGPIPQATYTIPGKRPAADASSCGSTLVLRPGWSRDLGEIRIDAPFCILGREGDYRPELFSSQVSRQHVEIAYEDGRWTVTQLGTTNPSWVITGRGRVQLAPGMRYVLHGGEWLRLANQNFVVGVESVEPLEPEVGEASPEPREDLVEGWFVTCGICGTIFLVRDESAQLRKCPNCVDPADSEQIAEVVPVHGTMARGTFTDVR